MRVQEEKHVAFVKDEIKAQAQDNKRQIANTHNKAYNLSKGVTGFRQIPIKSKGYTVKDLRKLKTSVDE